MWWIHTSRPALRVFPYHAHPHDFWRYEPEDLKEIFKDFEILLPRRDHEAPGVFLKAKKPKDYVPVDLSNLAIYSTVLGRRTKQIPKNVPLTRKVRLIASNIITNIKKYMSLVMRSCCIYGRL